MSVAIHQLGRAAAAGAVAVAVSVTFMAVSATAQAQPAFCAHKGAITAKDLAQGVSVGNCPVQGRLVVRSYGTGTLGAHVPPAGQVQVAQVLTTTGDHLLAVTNDHGRVTASSSLPTTTTPVAPSLAAPDVAAPDPACSQSFFGTLGFAWDRTLKWFYNQSTAGRAGLSGTASLADIRSANQNITLGINNCGFSQRGFRSVGAFQGTTAKFANVDSTVHCTSNFPDGQNTVSWGTIDDPSVLAVTCWDALLSVRSPIETDIYFGSNVGLVDTFPPTCTRSFDLQSVATHEWGHAFGLAHETSGPDEVMFPTSRPCKLRRHLGEGDYLGMQTLYGFR